MTMEFGVDRQTKVREQQAGTEPSPAASGKRHETHIAYGLVGGRAARFDVIGMG
jgi:hypothetical protein